MLLAPQQFAKLLPASMHARWDTWSKAWLPTQILPGIFMGAVLPTMNNSAHPLAHGALYVAAIAGFNASAISWHLRGRKEWTLPHDAWKTACENIEKKLSPTLHMPYRYRISAMCSLSQVLKSAELQRLEMLAKDAAANPNLRYKPPATVADWSDSYQAGTISAMLLKPEMLDTIHTNLGFTQLDIERWLEASYLHTIHEELIRPLPGTLDTIAQMANDNPATMAYYLLRHNRGVAQKLRLPDDEKHDGFWDDSPALPWFEKTTWAQYVENAQTIYNQLNDAGPTSLLAMDLYRQVAYVHVDAAPIDNNVFEDATPFI